MIEKAIAIAIEAFEGKTDKGGNPYVEHLWRVREKVRKYENPEIEVVAILHDLLEDCPEWNKNKLLDHFPETVVLAVECMTHKSDEIYADYIEGILLNDIAKIVKVADLEDNMNITRLNELTEKDFVRLRKYHLAYKKLTQKQF